ncbi:MAG: YicC/YloC family endoribonuclease [Pseudomonadota bacterium]
MSQIGLSSLTGFAAREGAAGDLAWSWELRSVNARGLDLRLRLPEAAQSLDQPVRGRLSAALSRGAVNVTLKLRSTGGARLPQPSDAALAEAAALVMRGEAALRAAGIEPAPSGVMSLLAVPGLMAEQAKSTELPQSALLDDFESALAELKAMRASEGAALAEVLDGHLDAVDGLLDVAKGAVTRRGETQEARFVTEIHRLTEAAGRAVDPDKLAQDLALLVVKGDVTEELDRLTAHLAAARELVAQGGPVGRKFDFLLQEFNREANTLCAKSGDSALTQAGLDLKLRIDQMREQIQNVE